MEDNNQLSSLSLEEIRFYILSPGQRDILFYIIQGYRNKEIAETLQRSYWGIKNQVSIILERTDTVSRYQLKYVFSCLKTKDSYFNSKIFITPSEFRRIVKQRDEKNNL